MTDASPRGTTFLIIIVAHWRQPNSIWQSKTSHDIGKPSNHVSRPKGEKDCETSRHDDEMAADAGFDRDGMASCEVLRSERVGIAWNCRSDGHSKRSSNAERAPETRRPLRDRFDPGQRGRCRLDRRRRRRAIAFGGEKASRALRRPGGTEERFAPATSSLEIAWPLIESNRRLAGGNCQPKRVLPLMSQRIVRARVENRLCLYPIPLLRSTSPAAWL